MFPHLSAVHLPVPKHRQDLPSQSSPWPRFVLGASQPALIHVCLSCAVLGIRNTIRNRKVQDPGPALELSGSREFRERKLFIRVDYAKNYGSVWHTLAPWPLDSVSPGAERPLSTFARVQMYGVAEAQSQVRLALCPSFCSLYPPKVAHSPPGMPCFLCSRSMWDSK